MAKTASKSKAKKSTAKSASKTKAQAAPRKREPIEVPSKATFGVDDKRAQYARLVVFNFAKSKQSKASVPKGADVNSVSNEVLSKAGVELVGGTLIKGAEGLEYIQTLSQEGSTTGRPLTKAYAAEVRPFLRRLRLSDSFGRRSRTVTKSEKNGASAEAPAEEAPAGEGEE